MSWMIAAGFESLNIGRNVASFVLFLQLHYQTDRPNPSWLNGAALDGVPASASTPVSANQDGSSRPRTAGCCGTIPLYNDLPCSGSLQAIQELEWDLSILHVFARFLDKLGSIDRPPAASIRLTALAPAFLFLLFLSLLLFFPVAHEPGHVRRTVPSGIFSTISRQSGHRQGWNTNMMVPCRCPWAAHPPHPPHPPHSPHSPHPAHPHRHL